LLSRTTRSIVQWSPVDELRQRRRRTITGRALLLTHKREQRAQVGGAQAPPAGRRASTASACRCRVTAATSATLVEHDTLARGRRYGKRNRSVEIARRHCLHPSGRHGARRSFEPLESRRAQRVIVLSADERRARRAAVHSAQTRRRQSRGSISASACWSSSANTSLYGSKTLPSTPKSFAQLWFQLCIRFQHGWVTWRQSNTAQMTMGKRARERAINHLKRKRKPACAEVVRGCAACPDLSLRAPLSRALGPPTARLLQLAPVSPASVVVVVVLVVVGTVALPREFRPAGARGQSTRRSSARSWPRFGRVRRRHPQRCQPRALGSKKRLARGQHK
jgi:hypothetical protein